MIFKFLCVVYAIMTTNMDCFSTWKDMGSRKSYQRSNPVLEIQGSYSDEERLQFHRDWLVQFRGVLIKTNRLL